PRHAGDRRLRLARAPGGAERARRRRPPALRPELLGRRARRRGARPRDEVRPPHGERHAARGRPDPRTQELPGRLIRRRAGVGSPVPWGPMAAGKGERARRAVAALLGGVLLALVAMVGPLADAAAKGP